MTNPNRLIWVSDQHVMSDDTENGGIGETKQFEANAFVSHIRGLEPYGFIDTGDCKDHYGTVGTADEHDNYRKYFYDKIPWLSVNPPRPGDTINALKPILPGNHDALRDSSDPAGVDYSPFNTKFWGPPYHFTADWPAPKVRFIAFHSYIIHAPDPLEAKWVVDAAERTWISDELAALPAGWKAIIACHPPILSAFGNNIDPTRGQSQLLALMAANNSKIVAAISGHRHVDLSNALQDGIRHITGLSTAYTASNSRGIFAILDYAPGPNQITVHAHYGPASDSFYGAYPTSSYAPVVLQL